MVGANAMTMIRNMQADPTGLTAFAVGIGLLLGCVIIGAMYLWIKTSSH